MIAELLSKYKYEEGDIVDFASAQGVAGLLYQEYVTAHTASGEKMLNRKEFLKLSILIDYCQKNYKDQVGTIGRLSRFYAHHGISMMMLKGCGVSLDWENPQLRPCGDLDIFLFDDKGSAWKRGDELVSKLLNVKIDEGHEHHTNFKVEGVDVENHYDFINVKGHKDAPMIEKKLKDLAFKSMRRVPAPSFDDSKPCEWILPSSDFNAIFLLRHMGQHFAGSEMTLRQLLDWAYFMDKHSREVDWKDILVLLDKIGLVDFFHQVNAICVDYLGFKEETFPNIKRDVALEKRIMDDVLCPEFTEKMPEGNVFRIILFKNRRYWANSWKRKLIFKDSPFVDFFYGSFAHLVKWKTIKESC